MGYYSYIDRDGHKELFQFPDGLDEDAALAVVETYPSDIVFWSDEDLTEKVVWLSFEWGTSYEGETLTGVSSTEEKARKICQDREDNWGEDRAVSPLVWGEDYPDRAEGYIRDYRVSKRVVDAEVE